MTRKLTKTSKDLLAMKKKDEIRGRHCIPSRGPRPGNQQCCMNRRNLQKKAEELPGPLLCSPGSSCDLDNVFWSTEEAKFSNGQKYCGKPI